MSLPRNLLLGLFGLLVLITVSIVVAWNAAGAPRDGQVAPNVEVGGVDVSSQSREELAATVAELAARYRDAPITIGAEAEQFDTTTAAIGLTLDPATTADHVMDIGRDGNFLSRYSSWLGSLVDDRHADVAITWDREALRTEIKNGDPGPRTEPVEPQLQFENGEMKFLDSAVGEGLDSTEANEKLPTAAAAGLPITLDIGRGEIAPRFETEDLRQAFETYRDEYEPIELRSGSKQAMLTFDQLQPWLETDSSGDDIALAINAERAQAGLPALVPDSGIPVVQAGWRVQGTTPRFENGTAGSGCCLPSAGADLGSALFPEEGDPARTVDLGVTEIQPQPVTEDPASLGIKENVATFTTYYPAGQPRVSNIHRISELTQGMVIKPGETFSLNDAVGQRTIEKGFVSDGVIIDGKFAKDVGGGISQYSTTLFNTAFFAGLEWTEYQAHTIYIDRYPYGREATISYPAPDQKIKNTTPYGILIWPTYTATSVTVDMYSTRFVDVEQTGQNTQPVGACTRVNTERTRRYLDGRTSVDQVHAVYQPEEGVRC